MFTVAEDQKNLLRVLRKWFTIHRMTGAAEMRGGGLTLSGIDKFTPPWIDEFISEVWGVLPDLFPVSLPSISASGRLNPYGTFRLTKGNGKVLVVRDKSVVYFKDWITVKTFRDTSGLRAGYPWSFELGIKSVLRFYDSELSPVQTRVRDIFKGWFKDFEESTVDGKIDRTFFTPHSFSGYTKLIFAEVNGTKGRVVPLWGTTHRGSSLNAMGNQLVVRPSDGSKTYVHLREYILKGQTNPHLLPDVAPELHKANAFKEFITPLITEHENKTD